MQLLLVILSMFLLYFYSGLSLVTPLQKVRDTNLQQKWEKR